MFEQACCVYCRDVIIRADEQSDWLDAEGQSGCPQQPGRPHVPDND